MRQESQIWAMSPGGGIVLRGRKKQHSFGSVAELRDKNESGSWWKGEEDM